MKYPGRTLIEAKDVIKPVLAAIAEQAGISASAFISYGERENTLSEHLDELRRKCESHSCGWREYLLMARSLLLEAMESDRPIPLVESVLELLRTRGIIAPNMIHVERRVWIVLRMAEQCLLSALTHALTLEQRTHSIWNTVYLTKVIETLHKRGEDIPEATVAHIAPLGWKHIRFIGDYRFTPQSGRSLDNLCPLRVQEEEERA